MSLAAVSELAEAFDRLTHVLADHGIELTSVGLARPEDVEKLSLLMEKSGLMIRTGIPSGVTSFCGVRVTGPVKSTTR